VGLGRRSAAPRRRGLQLASRKDPQAKRPIQTTLTGPSDGMRSNRRPAQAFDLPQPDSPTTPSASPARSFETEPHRQPEGSPAAQTNLEGQGNWHAQTKRSSEAFNARGLWPGGTPKPRGRVTRRAPSQSGARASHPSAPPARNNPCVYACRGALHPPRRPYPTSTTPPALHHGQRDQRLPATAPKSCVMSTIAIPARARFQTRRAAKGSAPENRHNPTR